MKHLLVLLGVLIIFKLGILTVDVDRAEEIKDKIETIYEDIK